MGFNLGWNYSFLGIVQVGFAFAFFSWILSRAFRLVVVIFQSRRGQIRIER